jgi:ubiquinone/menaquinone biosynthesis C-methylase UbiE
MLRVAKRSTPKGVDWRLGAAESLPVDDGWATAVWSLASVHHWRDIDAGLAEVVRVLAPGGRFTVLERRIADGATAHASHGWTEAQAECFALACADAGLIDVVRSTGETDRGTILGVTARARASVSSTATPPRP